MGEWQESDNAADQDPIPRVGAERREHPRDELWSFYDRKTKKIGNLPFD